MFELNSGFKKIESGGEYVGYNSCIFAIEEPLDSNARVILYNNAFIFSNGNDDRIDLYGHSIALVNGCNNKIYCYDYSKAIVFNNNSVYASKKSKIWAHDQTTVAAKSADCRVILNDLSRLSCSDDIRQLVLGLLDRNRA